MEKAKKQEKFKVFIINDKTEVCVYIENEKIKTSIMKPFNFIDNNSEKEKEKEKEKYIRITTTDKCFHNNEEKGKFHIKGIIDFINKFKNSIGNFGILKQFIKEDIEKGEPNHNIYRLLEDYYNILNNKLINEYKDFIKEENESKEIMDKIEDYILQRTYQYVYPTMPLYKDFSFYELTKLYDWIPAKHFGVKADLPLEAYRDCIKYFIQMEEKAFCISEKIKCYQMILNNLNKINEFYYGNSGKTAEDQTPIYTYIVLKSHPKRLISNINYIKCFTDGKSNKDPTIELFKNNTLVSIDKISEITAKSLNITEDEFKKRNSESNNKFY